MRSRKTALFLCTFVLIGGEEKTATDIRDPLPDGALARLGTIRQRVPQSAHLAIRPDGRTFVTVVAGCMIGEWYVAIGKQSPPWSNRGGDCTALPPHHGQNGQGGQ